MIRDDEQLEGLHNLLQQLLRDAGYEEPTIVEWINALKRQAASNDELEELRRENEQLKRELKRVQALQQRKAADMMSSKLRDALRE